ncbi:MAG: Uma2 family endonuclease [Symploca sp. SIO2E6]|nr:Uma2 family endonuclease [Symploca sp. SIO2E6]
MPLQAKPKLYTPEAYLLREDDAAERSEYRNGEIIPMAGGTANHNRIAGDFYKQFPTEISGQAYEIFIGDMKLWIPAVELYTYPDVMVIKGEPIYHQDRQSTVENPYLIVEVLSKSTRQYDQTDKFDAYRTIPSFQEYVLVDQYSFWVKQFAKTTSEQWIFTELVGKDAILQLESVQFQIPLAHLYQRVKFEKDENEG